MIRLLHSARLPVCGLALATALAGYWFAPAAAYAQERGFLGGLFGDSSGGAQQGTSNGRVAQLSAPELVVRIDQLEQQVRKLTGAIEQLQFHNQQLEQSLRRMQEDTEYRFQQLGGKGARSGAHGRSNAERPVQPPAAPAVPGRRSEAVEQAPPPAAPGRRAEAIEPAPQPGPPGRSDAFDPSQHPGAPGAPRMLGTMSTGGAPVATGPQPGPEPSVGIPGGRPAGAPLDLSSMSAPVPGRPPPSPAATRPNGQAGLLPPPPPRYPSATGANMARLDSGVQPPSQTPKDEFDLGYGYMLRKDYALAEDTFRVFLRKYPTDHLASDAQYWLGESMFQRQRYRDAAEAFLTVTTKYESTRKAADALLRLGQSLAALGEKEAACAALGEVGRKYPHAALNVKQSVEREQKRVHC